MDSIIFFRKFNLFANIIPLPYHSETITKICARLTVSCKDFLSLFLSLLHRHSLTPSERQKPQSGSLKRDNSSSGRKEIREWVCQVLLTLFSAMTVCVSPDQILLIYKSNFAQNLGNGGLAFCRIPT
ncbi:hypothetical protein TNIN_266341 [Trichonephila inaurata madagascariensis]|uniref:Uncharacterized protein n=1 Tax=Trichonephila inaurata madagascariensis TaxID=2747483 RepID=A0A8X6I5K5_9ARAC|nr:hypothetical protein TNIN_266341 [Trichonephila inaurata madagascariensis]